MTKDQLTSILEKHKLWILRKPDGARANLRDANLTGAEEYCVPQIDKRILEAIEAGGKLDMGNWHTCETNHCRAGWAIVLAGDKGRELESQFGSGAAGALIYAASRPNKRIPDFYASTKEAMEDIRKCAEEQQKAASA